MQDLNDKVTGGTLTAAEWNEVPSEIQNVIEGLGITLSGADLNQLGKAIAGYVANGTFYTDSGAADAYVLTAIGSKQSPTAYTDGLTARFTPGNINTGASTVNVASLGVKSIVNKLGEPMQAEDITAIGIITLRFDFANDEFVYDHLALRVVLRRSAVQSIPTGVNTQISFDAVSYNNCGAAAFTAAGVVVPAGVERLRVAVAAGAFDPNAVGQRVVILTLNASGSQVLFGKDRRDAAASGSTSAVVSSSFTNLTAADVIGILVSQDSGGALNTLISDEVWLSVEFN